MPLPYMQNRCKAKARSTGRQCKNPCAWGCRTCKAHGARPRHTVRSGPDHWNYQHGEATLGAKREAATTLRELKRLEVLMKAFGMLKKRRD